MLGTYICKQSVHAETYHSASVHVPVSTKGETVKDDMKSFTFVATTIPNIFHIDVHLLPGVFGSFGILPNEPMQS